VSIILVRYSEIGLKSKPVRKRFEAQLKENMMSMLIRDGAEALITSDESRFYVRTENIDVAVRSIRKVFGVASLSVAETCGSGLEEICEAAAKYSSAILKKGQSFAVRARREGTHAYTSMELAKEAGSSIFLANEDVKVDLTNPDVVFYIEVRNNKTFVFSTYVRAYAGLPLGSQGRVLAEVNDDRGLLSAWLMMKRGCRAIVRGTYGTDVLSAFDPSLKIVEENEGDRYKKDILGYVLGTSVDELKDVNVSDHSVPLYFPTIGMSDDEVSKMLNSIRREI